MYPNYFAIDLQRSDYSSSLHSGGRGIECGSGIVVPSVAPGKCLGGTMDPDFFFFFFFEGH